MLQRLLFLMEPINEYLGMRPEMAHRGLSPEEWLVLKELCGLLSPLKYVNTAIQGGADGFRSRAIFLCNDLVEILGERTLRIPGPRNPKAADEVKSVADLHEITAKARVVAIEQLKKRDAHAPTTDVEIGAMFFDPRYKSLSKDECGGGDHSERLGLVLGAMRARLKDS